MSDAGYSSGEGESDLTDYETTRMIETAMMTYLKIRLRMGEKCLKLLNFNISIIANFKQVYQMFQFLNDKINHIKRERRIQSK